MRKVFIAIIALLAAGWLHAQNQPSRSEYFTWINNTNEGATEEQTLINLAFFRYLKESYGMRLDIYAFDAGAIDGARFYGSMDSDRFRRQFPNGFGPISREAASMETSLGLWCGPDGFGNTPEEAARRSEMMLSLVRDYGFRLFKMDSVCGKLRSSKYDYFDRMMTDIRTEAPEFILLNHRLNLGPGMKHSTTYLLGGRETYIDVHMTNSMTAPHHRAQALSRKNPDGLTRLTEDHGVCLSSCLDFWEDDLILHAFARNLIVCPELYGNPWLLRDDEYPYLAYIFNLVRDYRDILPSAIALPEETYGPEAVSRGDGSTRFIVLRNLNWESVRYRIRLSEEVGLTEKGKVQVRTYHPFIEDLGRHAYGSEIEVEVLPFRSALVKLTTAPEKDHLLLSGCPYRIVNDRVGDARSVRVYGEGGSRAKIRISGDVPSRTMTVNFSGKPLRQPWHRKLSELTLNSEIVPDAEALYWATVYAADNNALEVRSLLRSGPTSIPEVQAARDAFFHQPSFIEREIWDTALFDDDPATAFSVGLRRGDPRVGATSGFCLDLGSVQMLDKLVLTSYDLYSIQPLKAEEGTRAYVSSDLKNWKEITFLSGPRMEIDLSTTGAFRYLRFAPCPLRLTEVYGYKDGKKVDRTRWRASNLFRPFGQAGARPNASWSGRFVLDEYPEGSYLCIAVPGDYGKEGVWAALKVDGKYVGCPDRAPSFPCNPYEVMNPGNGNYTYYVPLTPDMAGKEIEAVILRLENSRSSPASEKIHPTVWITCGTIPLSMKTLEIR